MVRGKGGVRVVERPPVRLRDRLLLPAFLQGLRDALGQLVESTLVDPNYEEDGAGAVLDAPGNAIQRYPEVRTPPVLGTRGAPVLLRDEQGRVRCNACQLCEFACPPRAISVEPAAITPETAERHASPKRYPRRFDLDMLRCIYCGFCEEVCPEGAVGLSQETSLSASTREELILDRETLLRRGEAAGSPPDEEGRTA